MGAAATVRRADVHHAPLFGSDVAVSGDTAFVSAPWYPTDERQAHGAVFVYGRESGSGEWTHQQTLVLDVGNSNGNTVDVDGTTGITTGDGTYVWVFERSGGTWERVEILTGDTTDEYAASVGALSGDTIVSGSSTELEAYVYERSDAGWKWIETFTPDGELGLQSLFGYAVDVDGDRLAVGDPTRTDDPGVVYVYERSDAGWERATKLTVDGSDGIGWSLALRGDRLLVGADEEPYVFDRSSGAWTRTRTIDYGGALAPGGTRAAIGERVADDETGAVYVVDL